MLANIILYIGMEPKCLSPSIVEVDGQSSANWLFKNNSLEIGFQMENIGYYS